MVKGEQGNNIWGIQSDPAATGKIYIRNNTIGSTSPNSIYSKGKANGATTGGTMVGISNEGIGSAIITKNEIQNLRNDGTMG
jgi:hypothetical protein